MKDRQQLTDQYCVFQAEGAVWAVAANSVREIADAATIVSVPEAPAEMSGVCHVRMEFVPVLSLRNLLGDSGSGQHAPEYLLILDGSEGPWALPIQRALSLHTLEIADGGAAGDAGWRSSGILGTATFQDQVLQVVDAAWLYQRATEALEGHWGDSLSATASAPASLSPAVTF